MTSIFHFGFLSGQYYYNLERWQDVRGEEVGSTRSPLHLTEWSTLSELSPEMLPNGTFDSGISGWEFWPANAQVTHDVAHLDNGCLKDYLPDNSLMSYSAVRNQAWFPMENGQNDWYRMDLSMHSDQDGYVLARVRGESQTNNPYALYERMLPFGPDRRDLSVYFQSPNAEQAQLVFVNQWTEPMYYLDNVHLHKVQVQANDPSGSQIILINDQFSDQTFTLEGCWSDVNGQYFSGSITLQPFKSMVLVKEDDALCGLSLGAEEVAATNARMNAYPNPIKAGAHLNFVASISGMVTLVGINGQVAASAFLPTGSMGMDLPGGLEKGVYALRNSGSNQAQRIVIE